MITWITQYGATNKKISVVIEHATSETHKVHVAMGLERAVSQKLKVSHFLLIPFTAKKKDANHILITQVICYFISVPKLLSFWYKYDRSLIIGQSLTTLDATNSRTNLMCARPP